MSIGDVYEDNIDNIHMLGIVRKVNKPTDWLYITNKYVYRSVTFNYDFFAHL